MTRSQITATIMAFVLLILVVGCDPVSPWAVDLNWINGGNITDVTWLNNSTLVGTTWNNELVKISYPGFSVSAMPPIDMAPDTVNFLGFPAANPSGTEIALSVGFDGGEFWNLVRYTVADGATVNQTGYAGGSIFRVLGATYETDANIIYTAHEWGDPSSLNMSTYNTGAGVLANHGGGTGDFANNEIYGDSWWWPGFYPGGNDWTLLGKFDWAFNRPTFVVLNNAGTEIFNGLGLIIGTWIAGGDWIDADTFLITVGRRDQRQFSVMQIDLSGIPAVDTVYYLVNEAIEEAYRPQISPDGTKAVLMVWANDGSGGNGYALVELDLE